MRRRRSFHLFQRRNFTIKTASYRLLRKGINPYTGWNKFHRTRYDRAPINRVAEFGLGFTPPDSRVVLGSRVPSSQLREATGRIEVESRGATALGIAIVTAQALYVTLVDRNRARSTIIFLMAWTRENRLESISIARKPPRWWSSIDEKNDGTNERGEEFVCLEFWPGNRDLKIKLNR